MDEWKSRIEKVYRPLERDGQQRRNDIMARVASMPLPQSQTQQKGLIMKIAIASGLAAGLILAVGLSIVLFVDHQAGAAQELQQVAETNKAYKGWVHIGASSQPTDGSALPPPTMPAATAASQHINTADGTLALVVEHEGKKRIHLFMPARREVVTYDSMTGEVRIETMMADTAKSMPEALALSPVMIAGALAEFKKATGRDPEEVLRKRENGEDRYDITLFSDEQEGREFCKERGICLKFTKMTLWTDPQTNLIQKMACVAQGLPISASYSYGKPEIRSVYDLGVPRDAKVIDNRVSGSLAAVLDRLDGRVAKGLGNCLAIMTIADLAAANEPPNKSVGYAHLYATDADRWFVGHYRIGNTTGRAAEGTFLPAAPAGWPAPDLKQFITALKDVAPAQYWIMGNELGWTGWELPDSRSYNSRVIAAKERTVLPPLVGLGSEIWPSRYKGFGGGGANAKVEAISDPNRADLMGLRCETTVATGGQEERREYLSWVDPAKDDMPVETTWRVYQEDRLTTEVSTKYLEYAQLPSGQWYPKRWQEVRLQSVPGRAAAQPTKTIRECRLLVAPDMRLDKDWFVNPAEKFAEKK